MHTRFSAVLVAIAALSAVFAVAPAQADTTTNTASWDYATGLSVTPGTPIEVATITIDDPGGLCTVEMTATNGQSQHPGNNLLVEHDGAGVLMLEGVEDEPFTTTTGSVSIDGEAGDVVVVYLEPTQAHRTSIAGRLDVMCTNQPPTTTTTEPPGSTTTTQPPGSTTTTEPPGPTTTTEPPGSTTTTEPPSVTTTTTDPGDPEAPPTGSTPPAPGSHEEPGGEPGALYALLAILGVVGSAVLLRRDRAGL